MRNEVFLPPTKLKSLSFSLHRRLSRRRSPPAPMTKKKKPKDKVTRSSPSGSHSSEFSSSDLAADSTSDLQVLALSGSSVSPDTAFATSVNPSGAVTAIIPDRAQQYPKSGIDNAANALSPDFTVPSAKTAETLVPVVSSGAVTATIPNNELSGAVKATTSAAPQETEKSAQEDAVKAILEEGEFVPPHSTEPIAAATVPMEKTPPVEKSNTPKPTENATSSGPQSAAEHWRRFVKPGSIKLDPEGTSFTLDSGEACIRIPNSVIEKNKKVWDSFIIGQFYEEPPARGAVHAIVNGIWSKQRRDISVSKMEGHTFLFRVPCPHARRRILSQCLWQVDGQTMFVAKWSPGVLAAKPELTTVPVWLDFTGVPLQFFNRDALKEIAGLVGHPLYLHPATENLTNIEVAKVYTVIDPRKPLPEAVNAQFDSGEVVRITVSSPWLPSLCGHCRKVGHTVSKCPNVPPKCDICGSVKHNASVCTRKHSGLKKDHPTLAGPPKDKALIAGPQKDKAPIASQYPIVGRPPITETRPFSSTLGTKKYTPASLQSDSETRLKKQLQTKQGHLQNHKNMFVVDLNGTGFISSGHSAQGIDPESDYSSESFSEEDDNPQIEADRYLPVVTRGMKKSARKARARGPLNL